MMKQVFAFSSMSEARAFVLDILQEIEKDGTKKDALWTQITKFVDNRVKVNQASMSAYLKPIKAEIKDLLKRVNALEPLENPKYEKARIRNAVNACLEPIKEKLKAEIWEMIKGEFAKIDEEIAKENAQKQTTAVVVTPANPTPSGDVKVRKNKRFRSLSEAMIMLDKVRGFFIDKCEWSLFESWLDARIINEKGLNVSQIQNAICDLNDLIELFENPILVNARLQLSIRGGSNGAYRNIMFENDRINLGFKKESKGGAK
jgi:hypothetical protein